MNSAGDPAGAILATTVLDSQVNEATLQKRLGQVFAGSQYGTVMAACVTECKSFCVTTGVSEDSRRAEDLYVKAGCLTKLFTATLLESFLNNGELSTDDGLASSLPSLNASFDLRRITIDQLLNHTHGLDDSLCSGVPREENGFIDEEALVSMCSRQRVSLPGEVFSYSNAGAWIIAAAMERIRGIKYEEILQSELFEPLGIRPRFVGRDSWSTVRGVCPATGGLLMISIGGFLAFLQAIISREAFWASSGDQTSNTPLPGWNPFELAIYRGWKFHGNGWYGHSSISPDRSTSIVRINPARKIGMIICSTHLHASMVAGKLFGRAFPDFSSLKVPKALAVEADHCESFQGQYRNAAETFCVAASEAGKLELVWPQGKATLIPAEDNVLLVSNASSGSPRFLQLLRPQEGFFRYLWNGQRLYRNERDPVKELHD